MAWSLLQANATQGAGTSAGVNFPGASTLHSLQIAWLSWSDAVDDIISVTSSNETWVRVPGSLKTDATNSWSGVLYYVKDSATGANPGATVTFTSSKTTIFIEIVEFTGQDPTALADAANAAAGTSTTPASGAATTIADGELVVSGLVLDGATATITAGTNLSFVRADGNGGVTIEYATQGSAGSINADWSLNISRNWVVSMATFKAFAAPADDTPWNVAIVQPQISTVSIW